MIDATATRSLGEAHKVLCSLFDTQVKLGRDLLSALAGLAPPGLPKLLSGGKCGTGCCEVPAPCWVPRSLGERFSHACPCQTVCIRVRVTNCDAQSSRVVRIAASGEHVTVSPPQLLLEPLERGVVEVCMKVPGEAEVGETLESVVRIHGCRDYYLRWTVTVCSFGLECRDEVEVDDCPDLVHHWYDHFYCRRSCPNPATPSSTGAPGRG